MRAKEENVSSLCMVVEREIWSSRFPSPPGLIRMFKTREGKLANTAWLKVRNIPNRNWWEIVAARRFTEGRVALHSDDNKFRKKEWGKDRIGLSQRSSVILARFKVLVDVLLFALFTPFALFVLHQHSHPNAFPFFSSSTLKFFMKCALSSEDLADNSWG